MKNRIALILVIVVMVFQSLPLNVFAYSVEISAIMSHQQNDIMSIDVIDDYYINDVNSYENFSENIENNTSLSYNSYDAQNADDYSYETVAQRCSQILRISIETAEKMIRTYGSGETALYEAELYRSLIETFYTMDYSDVRGEYIDMLAKGFGAQRVVYSGIVALVLGDDISDVVLKNEENSYDEDEYVTLLAQQFFVSPEYTKSYIAKNSTTSESLYKVIMIALQKMYPDAFGVSTMSIDAPEESSAYPDSPFYTNISENEHISPVSGSLTYIMNLANIPGINGMDIDLSLRYDSDRSVVQGEFFASGGSGYTPIYDSNGNIIGGHGYYAVAECYKPYDWDTKSPFMFGTGWRLNYDYIYRRDGILHLVLTDGREYKISGTSPEYTLSGYNSDSFSLTGSSNVNETYILTFIDGTVERFDSDGVLTSITDRYGNRLSFTHTKISEPLDVIGETGVYTDRLTITNDNTTVYIDYNLTHERIKLPDGSIIRLKYAYRNNDYLLTTITDQTGQVTEFTYISELCGKLDYSIETTNNSYIYSFQKLYYNYLTSIVFPTSAKVEYEYLKVHFRYVTIPVVSRKEVIGNKSYNCINYSFNNNGGAVTADFGNKTVTYGVNSDGFIVRETEKTGDTVRGWIGRVYDNKLGLPTKITYVKTSPGYGTIIDYHSWSDGMGHGGVEPIYDWSSYVSRVETYEYDSVGQITKQIVNGITTTNTYDSRYHLLTQSVNSGDGQTIKTVNTLSNDGRSIVSTNVYNNSMLSGRTDYTYDSRGNVTILKEYTDSANCITSNNAYSAKGWLISSSSGNVSVRYEYDVMGRMVSETDGNGKLTSYEYDKLGRLIKVTYPDGSKKSYSYTIQPGVNDTIVSDECGYKSTYKYDGMGKILSVYSSDTLIEKYEYDEHYRVSEKTDANGAITKYEYDYDDCITDMTVTNAGTSTIVYHETCEYEWVYATQRHKTVKTVIGDSYSPSVVSFSYDDIYGRTVR